MNAVKPPTAATVKSGKSRKRFVTAPGSGKLPYLFFGCLTLGALPIVAPQFFLPLGFPVVEYVPPAITIVFCLWAVLRGQQSEGETTERLGDACYYIGFLLTLISLVSSLYLSNDQGSTSSALLDRLGVALSTTVIGLLGRTILVQSHKSPHDHFDAADEGLSTAVNSYTSALRLGTQHIEETLLDIQRSLGSLSSDIEKQIRDTSEAYHTTVTAMTGAHHSGQKELIDGYRKKLDSITLVPKKTMDQFDRVASTLTGRLEKLDQTLENMTETMGEAGASVKDLKDIGQSSLSIIQAQSETAISAVSGLSTRSAEGISEAATRLQASTDRATQALDGIGAPLSRVAGELQSAVPQFKAMTDILVDIGNVAAAVERQMHAVESLESAVEQAGTSLAKLGEAAQSHTAGLTALGKENELLSETFAAQRDRFLSDQKDLLEQLKKQRDEAERVAQDVAEQFAGLVGRIDKSLKA